MTKPEASMDFIFCFRYLLSKQFYSIVFCMDRSSEIMKRALIELFFNYFQIQKWLEKHGNVYRNR